MIAAEELEGRVRQAEEQLVGERKAVEKGEAEATAQTQIDEEALAELRHGGKSTAGRYRSRCWVLTIRCCATEKG